MRRRRVERQYQFERKNRKAFRYQIFPMPIPRLFSCTKLFSILVPIPQKKMKNPHTDNSWYWYVTLCCQYNFVLVKNGKREKQPYSGPTCTCDQATKGHADSQWGKFPTPLSHLLIIFLEREEVVCEICGDLLQKGSMKRHKETQHPKDGTSLQFPQSQGNQ